MSLFIPEWPAASGRDMRLRSVLAELDDDHVVRRPLRPEECAAQLFVQHPVRGWLALAASSAGFAQLDAAQLFDAPEREAFERRLDALRQLGGMPALVILWGCGPEEAAALARQVAGRPGLVLVGREGFLDEGAARVAQALAPIAPAAAQAILARHFPEAEIATAAAVRRHFEPVRHDDAGLDRRFLDADQEWAVKLDLSPSQEQRRVAADFAVRLVNGVAGSGKTLIAVQRARMLAEREPAQRVLLLIHNTPIVADLQYRLRRAGGALPGNLEILTFSQWIVADWKAAFGADPALPGRRQLPELVRRHRHRWPALKASDRQLAAELDFIDEALVADEAAYLVANRAGRGFALRALERAQVWALREAVHAGLAREGRRPWSALPREVGAARRRGLALGDYDHVLVDEAQFFAPSWFQAVKDALRPGGQLFLCADPNQGFLRSRLSWKSVGLDVLGRTKRLRRSYRTTRAILEAANALLAVQGVDEGAAGEDFLAPDYAGMVPGVRPVLLQAASPQDAIERVVGELAAAATQRAIPLGAFLVLYGDNVNKVELHARLQRRLGADAVWWLNDKQQKRRPLRGDERDYLRLANLDTATGLEASVVFLLGVERLLRAGEAQEADETREELARKLYMAMTRAAERLVVVSSQRVPAEVAALFEQPARAVWARSGA